MTDLLIRRDTPITRGTKLAYRVVLDYPVTLDADGWLDEGEDQITLDELEKRISEDGGRSRWRPLPKCIIDAGIEGEPIGEEVWVPLAMDEAAPHHRPVAFETPYEAESRGRSYAAKREYVTLGQACCPECHSFKGGECDTCEDGVPAKAVAS